MFIISNVLFLNFFFHGVLTLFLTSCAPDLASLLEDVTIPAYTLANSSCSFKISNQSLSLDHTLTLDALNSTLELTNSNFTVSQNANFSNLLIIVNFSSDFLTNGVGYLFFIENCVVLFEVTAFKLYLSDNFR